MLQWIPVKFDLLYYKLDPDVDDDTITFRLIWFTVSEFVGFMGLFQIVLSSLFLLDMILTWRHPIKYLSTQKHTIPVFLTASKVTQGVIYVFIAPYPKVIRIVDSTLVAF